MSTKSTSFQNEYFKKCFDVPNPGLRGFFERSLKGQPDEYRTPFYKGKDLQQVLDDWSKTLNSLESEWPTLLEFENDLRKKVGPMSIMLPLSERLSDVDSYYDSILLESKPINDEAVRRGFKDLSSIRGIRRRSMKETYRNMKKSTNSGAPYFRDKSTVKVRDNIHMWMDGDELCVNWSEFPRSCAILGWRGQEGGPEKDDVKQRVIWMFPFELNLLELSFYQPLIAALQKRNTVPAWVSMDAVDAAITKLFDTKHKNDLIVCTDFSKFDQHFNHDMQQCAKQIYTMAGVDDEWLNKVFPIKYSIPLAVNWGEIYFGNHGMASGSGGTNADETVTHKCLQHEAALLSGSELNPYSQCLGDDGILSYPGITVDSVMQAYSSHGQEMNFDKQYASTQDVTYLRRWHHADYRWNNVCVGVYSTYRALGRLAEQERFYDPDKWSAKMVALRQLSIIENCKYHPLREQFADYCMKGDKYRLGLDIPGFLDKIEKYAKEATDYMPEFLGYTKGLQSTDPSRGIKSWWIVNYLKSKR